MKLSPIFFLSLLFAVFALQSLVPVCSVETGENDDIDDILALLDDDDDRGDVAVVGEVVEPLTAAAPAAAPASTSASTGTSSTVTSLDAEEEISEASENTFVKLFGPKLYKWNDKRDEILELSTTSLLKGKDVIGLYFSASWCGPCRQFTPQLAQFYQDMNKKGRNFEIIWVSRDRTADEFAEYFYKMPWLAIPVDNLNTISEQLGAKYQMRGIPHLVILDGDDASVYTLDGRTAMMNDKYGVEFPWRPKSLTSLLPKPLKRLLDKQVDKAKVQFKLFLDGVVESLAPRNVLQTVDALSRGFYRLFLAVQMQIMVLVDKIQQAQQQPR